MITNLIPFHRMGILSANQAEMYVISHRYLVSLSFEMAGASMFGQLYKLQLLVLQVLNPNV